MSSNRSREKDKIVLDDFLVNKESILPNPILFRELNIDVSELRWGLHRVFRLDKGGEKALS